MLDDNGWMVSKACRIKQILKENQPNKRNSKFTPATYQDIFWLENQFKRICLQHPVSMSLFFIYKTYCCVRPTEKEKLSCLCINCLNPHLLLRSINNYQKSKVLPSHDSLTEYINRLENGEDFAEANDKKPCKFYSYMTATESYIVKEGKPVEYTRTARVDDTKPVKTLVNLIKDGGKKYLKHRTYVDNCSNVFPLMKDAYS